MSNSTRTDTLIMQAIRGVKRHRRGSAKTRHNHIKEARRFVNTIRQLGYGVQRWKNISNKHVHQAVNYNDPHWTYQNYNYDTLFKDSERLAETLNATNPDLSAFRKRNGKLIIYSGWSDAAAPGLAVVGYYEDVLAYDKTAAEDARLFMMPGVEHCFGGPGPSFVNFLTEIDKWVESGIAPEQIAAYWLDEKFQPTGSRLLCAYPKVAKYDGKGDPRDVSSFSCVDGE